jgi:hypothetical protein
LTVVSIAMSIVSVDFVQEKRNLVCRDSRRPLSMLAA